MAEISMSFWMGLSVGAVVGGLLVGLVVWWRAHRLHQAGRSRKALEAQHAEFRGRVNAHFIETAGLINRMTDSYKAVFDHLSQGAEELVEDRAARQHMPKVGDVEVRLKHIGHRVSGSSQADTREDWEPDNKPRP